MYYFTGNNIFGQWIPFNENIVDKLSYLVDYSWECPKSICNIKDGTLIYIGWSFNIMHSNGKYYITGDYAFTGKYIELIDMPQEWDKTSNHTVLCNDYNLILVNKDKCEYEIINLENKLKSKFSLLSETSVKNNPKKPRNDERIMKCVAFNDSVMFLTRHGSVYSGILPNLIETEHIKGTPLDVQCGNEHFMLLTDAGVLYTWGSGRRLQLGHGDVSNLDTPTEVEALAGIKIAKISAGGWHSLALSEFGDLYAWGWNDVGQLGIREKDNDACNSYSLPTLVDIHDEDGIAINNNVIDIACGSKHSAILLDDYSVWTSGNNNYGQLGFSNKKYNNLNSYKKCKIFESNCEIKCGQWSTVIRVV